MFKGLLIVAIVVVIALLVLPSCSAPGPDVTAVHKIGCDSLDIKGTKEAAKDIAHKLGWPYKELEVTFTANGENRVVPLGDKAHVYIQVPTGATSGKQLLEEVMPQLSLDGKTVQENQELQVIVDVTGMAFQYGEAVTKTAFDAIVEVVQQALQSMERVALASQAASFGQGSLLLLIIGALIGMAVWMATRSQ